MTRKDYIAGLEEIRKQVKQIGAAFRAVDLTDAEVVEVKLLEAPKPEPPADEKPTKKNGKGKKNGKKGCAK